jgi:hypothetical protein
MSQPATIRIYGGNISIHPAFFGCKSLAAVTKIAAHHIAPHQHFARLLRLKGL